MTFPKGSMGDYKHPSCSVRDPVADVLFIPALPRCSLPWPPMEEIPRGSQIKPPPQTR